MTTIDGRDPLPWFQDLYASFNARDEDAVLRHFTPDVHWPNG
ncbi:nuclear transport factor 2-like protein [Nakamurella alba]|nr:hypothetical protein [Nakamurella alba]